MKRYHEKKRQLKQKEREGIENGKEERMTKKKVFERKRRLHVFLSYAPLTYSNVLPTSGVHCTWKLFSDAII